MSNSSKSRQFKAKDSIVFLNNDNLFDVVIVKPIIINKIFYFFLKNEIQSVTVGN
jgi:hypothetical protein